MYGEMCERWRGRKEGVAALLPFLDASKNVFLLKCRNITRMWNSVGLGSLFTGNHGLGFGAEAELWCQDCCGADLGASAVR